MRLTRGVPCRATAAAALSFAIAALVLAGCGSGAGGKLGATTVTSEAPVPAGATQREEGGTPGRASPLVGTVDDQKRAFAALVNSGDLPGAAVSGTASGAVGTMPDPAIAETAASPAVSRRDWRRRS